MKKIFNLSHLPTWFFIIGYPAFWIELYYGHARQGVTSPIVWVLFAVAAALALFSWLKTPHNWRKDVDLFWHSLPLKLKLVWSLAFILAAAIAVVSICAASQPIHLQQEQDCLQYHYTLPRQHLILSSFGHIPWAADDLFLLPVDFALAPFWFSTALPNKWPQLIIMLGLIAVGVRLTAALAAPGRPWAPLLFLLCFLGTHGFGVQMGTGMLDLTVAYLFFAALDSLRTGQWLMAALELAFFVWAKPFLPLQTILAAGVMLGLFGLAKILRFQKFMAFPLLQWQRGLLYFALFSVVVAGPFVFKSMYYAGTPLFPFSPGIAGHAAIAQNPTAWHSLQQASHMWISGVKDEYGHGRDGLSFIRHFWLLAVPENGVNNTFDYPLGLTYLLLLGPFIFYCFDDVRRRQLSPLAALAVIFWALWWIGSQQSRFLFVPLLIIFMVTTARLSRPAQTLLLCLIAALALNCISVWNAHKADLFRPASAVLRPQDKTLVELSQAYWKHPNGYVQWDHHDAAYAQFPVMVTREQLPHTMAF